MLPNSKSIKLGRQKKIRMANIALLAFAPPLVLLGFAELVGSVTLPASAGGVSPELERWAAHDDWGN